MSNIIDDLLHPRNAYAWQSSKPLGVEGDNLIKFIEEFHDLLASSIAYHLKQQDITPESAIIKIKFYRIGRISNNYVST